MAAVSLSSAAFATQLEPYKDDVFAYPGILKTADNGDYTVVDYSEMRDINGRDVVPELRVKPKYLSLDPKKSQKDLVVTTETGPVKVMAVGKLDPGASVITIYLHGQGGNRQQGMNDFTFGGNFNRIKNLMDRNGGLYLTPEFRDFGDKGEAQVAGLITYFKSQSPQAKLFVACGSMGGNLCWRLIQDGKVSKDISGLILMGSLWDDNFIGSPAFKRRVPIFFGHGSRDPVFAIDDQEAFYRKIRTSAKGYPVRFTRFETGNHGTPIRMTDWRAVLNWMLTVSL
ncbi:alpha/beta hydrolase [Phyllobacterium sp. 628]|uniref:alpha/beta hydrolase n=1 Tax=Phyllobacterium sp. 628 TaxID=2718938 RepID=UPI00166259A6|nr:alpha/beta hydrolase [Phyllobacterium sp. 628]QND54265.1 alpha/beta hydrolase [Phyllobacterium sp. 628]